jgi:hypothetical protein
MVGASGTRHLCHSLLVHADFIFVGARDALCPQRPCYVSLTAAMYAFLTISVCSTRESFATWSLHYVLSKYDKSIGDLILFVLHDYASMLLIAYWLCSFHFVLYFAGSLDLSDPQFSVQYLFRRLGNEVFIGQRIILAASQKISNISERLLLVDPFDDVFPDMHGNIFIM